jgi:predicted DNA-binding antitoxin AbrB/MazE fold protein
MNPVQAIYQGGVFRPLGDVVLGENQRVWLNVQPIATQDARKWLDSVKRLQNRIVRERGYFPDSAPDIAQDRLRDE